LAKGKNGQYSSPYSKPQIALHSVKKPIFAFSFMHMLKNINTIIWDWNGTLLNDRDLCIKSMNRLLSQRGLPLLTIEKYLNVFTFPVKDYYQALGFDFSKEPFEIPAEEFIVHYNEGITDVPLFDDVIDVLMFFRSAGKKQYIVSAMEQSALTASVGARNISDFFIKANGIADNLANGKTEIARVLIQEEIITPYESIFIGDTLHDAEVAESLGMSYILVARGHQDKLRLTQQGNPVLDSLADLMELF
jgi:phosphoglycolate phosphatase